jgi:hypothetical protein
MLIVGELLTHGLLSSDIDLGSNRKTVAQAIRNQPQTILVLIK